MGQADIGATSCSSSDVRLTGSRDACSSSSCCSQNSSLLQCLDEQSQIRSRIPHGPECRGSDDRRGMRRGWIGCGVRDQLTRTGLTCILLLGMLAGSGVAAQPGNALDSLASGAPAPQVSRYLHYYCIFAMFMHKVLLCFQLWCVLVHKVLLCFQLWCVLVFDPYKTFKS